MWTIVSNMHNDAGDTCEHCGHAIKETYWIKDPETGITMKVGSDCVIQLVQSPDVIKSVQRQTARYKRATRQWKAQKPPAKPDETREQYINRRVLEMGNALTAFRHSPELQYTKLRKVAAERLAERGIVYPLSEPHYLVEGVCMEGHEKSYVVCPRCNEIERKQKSYWQAECDELEKLRNEFDAKYQANRFDWNRAIWDVRKI